MFIDDPEVPKWSILELGFKWPHQGFALGWDIETPNQQQDPEQLYCRIAIYLGCFTVIYTWGDTRWEL